MRWLILTMICISTLNASAMSFLDKEHSKKLAKEAKATRSKSAQSHIEAPCSLSPLQLFQSPIQPGGKYMLSGNLVNLLVLCLGEKHPLVRKITKGMSLVDRYAEVLLESDSDLIEFRNNPAPHRGWKIEYKALKDRKRAEYRLYVLEMAR